MNQMHVVPAGAQWEVKTDESSEVLYAADTQAIATDWARAYAAQNEMELAVHAETGEIRKKDSSGAGVDDPNSPDHT